LAEASTADMDVVLDDWSLKRGTDGHIHAKVGGKDFSLDLNFATTQPVMLQGENGFSRKGPLPAEASHYYSLPHLSVSGTVLRGAKPMPVKGTAWLDREWSSSYLDPNAVGWDWVGLNLDDGGAVMAFQIRDAMGHALWAGGSFRDASGELTRFAPEDVRFTTERRWHSPRTDTDYPVERVLSVQLAAGARQWRITPLFDDQELDSRGGGGPVYWEGAARVPGGRGYLELTGYFKPLKM
jgi:predicted secreted hydrolase